MIETMSNHRNISLLKDVVLIAFSIFLSVVLVKSEILIKILTSTQELEFLGSFIAGIFFTSIFTTAPAIVTLGEIAQANSVLWTAAFGALGSVTGDLIIFLFIRDRFSDHISEFVPHRGVNRIKKLFKLRYFRWFTFLLGGAIIASPFPDEAGISLLGFSKLRMSWFIPLSYVFNFIGIFIIGSIAKAL
jgi:hypothetical protein